LQLLPPFINAIALSTAVEVAIVVAVAAAATTAIAIALTAAIATAIAIVRMCDSCLEGIELCKCKGNGHQWIGNQVFRLAEEEKK
jgi:hypothetical protein